MESPFPSLFLPSAGPDKYIVSNISARPHRLIVVLRRIGVVRRRHVRPSARVIHRRGPLLRRLGHASVYVGREGAPPWWRHAGTVFPTVTVQCMIE